MFACDASRQHTTMSLPRTTRGRVRPPTRSGPSTRSTLTLGCGGGDQRTRRPRPRAVPSPMPRAGPGRRRPAPPEASRRIAPCRRLQPRAPPPLPRPSPPSPTTVTVAAASRSLRRVARGELVEEVELRRHALGASPRRASRRQPRPRRRGRRAGRGCATRSSRLNRSLVASAMASTVWSPSRSGTTRSRNSRNAKPLSFSDRCSQTMCRTSSPASSGGSTQTE